LDEVGVEALGAVVLARDRDDLRVGELPGGVADEALFVGQLEVDHRAQSMGFAACDATNLRAGASTLPRVANFRAARALSRAREQGRGTGRWPTERRSSRTSGRASSRSGTPATSSGLSASSASTARSSGAGPTRWRRRGAAAPPPRATPAADRHAGRAGGPVGDWP